MENKIPVRESVLEYISVRIRNVLKEIDFDNIQEIRLRIASPVVIVTPNGSSFITQNGRLTQILSNSCVYCSEFDVEDTLNKCCRYSVHSHIKDLLNGFITLPAGARVGVCGTAVYENDNIKSIKDITCLNIRIPRNVLGSSLELLKHTLNDGLDNILIVGPPSSGKTTLIKDIAYQISDGLLGKYHKVCVIDERMEIASNKASLGPNTDVIKGYPKSTAIQIAIRTMSPDLIVCDEVGLDNEIAEILNGINCGVKFVITAHSNENDFILRKDLISLCRMGGFNKIAFLNGNNIPGKIKKVVTYNELLESSRGTFNLTFSNAG